MTKYLPAISFLAKYNTDVPITWWNDKSLVKYNYGLVSPAHFLDTFDFRKTFNVPSDFWLLGDSGGFQILTLKSKGKDIPFNREKILKWQEINCNAGLILDIPPTKIGGGALSNIVALDDNEFNKCAKETYQNAKYAYENRTNKNMLLYNVIQGVSIKNLNIWYNVVTDNGNMNLEGYAVAPKPSHDIWRLTMVLSYLLEKGINKNVHVLGVSGFNTIPIMIYMKKYIENLTYDSASYAQGNISSKIFLPITLNLTYISKKKSPELKKIPCNCCVCIQCDNMDMVQNYLTLHNLKQTIDYNKILNIAVDDVDVFLSCCKNSNIIKNAIDFIELSRKIGLEKTMTKYQKYFSNKTNLKQKSVFNNYDNY